MTLTVITNIPAPYRDEVFRELQTQMSGDVVLLASDEPGRNWAGRNLRYSHRRAPALALKYLGMPRYLAFPTWLRRRGWLMVAGFGQPALTTALFRPSSTLLWTEATPATDGKHCGPVRTRIRAWLARRCRACVAVGTESAQYCEQLGAREIVMLPNVHGTQPKRTAANSTAHGIDQTRSLVLAHVGDWSYAKGADRSTEVVEKLRDKLCKTGVVVQFVIAGHILDVERPPESVHLGYLDSDRLWSELMAYEPQFLLLMSRGDRWGFVVSEAMARGVVPVVTPEVGAAADLVRPLGSHLICNSGAEAADAILSLFGDRTEFERLSNQARSIIESRTSRWAVQEFARGLSRLEGGAFATEVA